MNHSLKIGISFGLTSGIITTLGLIIGLNASTGSRLAVIAGILTIAVADACSDAMGIHISEESENKHTTKEIWQSTIATFLTKFIVASSFALPFIVFPIASAMIVAISWGLLLLILFNYLLAKQENKKPMEVIGEHLTIAIIVIAITQIVGSTIKIYFK